MTREQVDKLTGDYERLKAKREFLERKLSQVRDECFAQRPNPVTQNDRPQIPRN